MEKVARWEKSEDQNNLLGKSIPAEVNIIACIIMCIEYRISTIFLDINILHLNNLSHLSQKRSKCFF